MCWHGAVLLYPDSCPLPCALRLQKLSGQQRNWRIAATGVVLSLEAMPRVVKKLKLVGTPFKVRQRILLFS